MVAQESRAKPGRAVHTRLGNCDVAWKLVGA